MKSWIIQVPLAAILSAVMGSVLAGELYRWVDEQGKVHYSDVPGAEAVRPEQKKFADSPLPDAALPYETRRAREIFPVTLYVAENCKDLCQRARDLLNKRGIPFTEKSVATPEDAEAFRKMSGGELVPALVIGSNWLKGFVSEQWNEELDIAGYPRTAPYGFRPAAPLLPAKKPPVQPPQAPSPEPAPEPTAPSESQ